MDEIMIRKKENESMMEMEEYENVKVINELKEEKKNCKIMEEVIKYEENRGKIKGKKFEWMGDGKKVMN